MLKPNTRYKELKDTYLFNTIYRKTNEYLEANPDKNVLRMGVGDVSVDFSFLLRNDFSIGHKQFSD